MPSSGVQTCALDRKSTRLNSSHGSISYAAFCLKKKNKRRQRHTVHKRTRHDCTDAPMPAHCGLCHRVAYVCVGVMIRRPPRSTLFFFFNDTATTEIYTLSLHDALPI